MICVTVISANPASFDYILGEKSLPVFAIVLGWSQESAYALQMFVGDGVAADVSIWGLISTGTFNSAVPYFICLSPKLLAASPQPGGLNSSSLICFCHKLCIQCCTVLEIVPITLPGLSSSLSLPCTVSCSSSSSSYPSYSSSELRRWLWIFPIAFNISPKVVSGFLVVAPTFSAVVISCSSCIIAVCASGTSFLAPAVSLST